MRVILQQDIPQVGRKYDIKDVKDGYARNFLLPQKLVVVANEERIGEMRRREVEAKKRKEKEVKGFRELAERLASMAVTIQTRIGEKGVAFGSVSRKDIADELKKQGITVEDDWVGLEEPIKTTGEHTVTLHFPHGIKGEVKVFVEAE